ncbi:hypothetical protein FACS189440_10540 [Bacteroidia bacterium]|nr:hypothetical protein FACS189440_10540 [Bacteroidia bacterium]
MKAEVNDTKNILESDYTNNTKTVDITVLSVGIQDIATGKVYAADGRLFVSAYPAGSSVTIYNVTGQSIATHRVASDNLIVDLNPGAYIVNIQSQGKTNVYKVLVK